MPDSTPKKIEVALGDASYSIVIGEGILGAAAQWLGAFTQNRHVVIIADEAVAVPYLETLTRAIGTTTKRIDTITITSGEAAKSFASYEKLMEDILGLDHGVGRDCLIMALGGGVTGDLAGFVAASLMRGVDFIQIPTTLLAMVDSSVGGKTGINSRVGKNLIGAFHQPLAVLIDPACLASLPARDFTAGYAEVVKYGLLADAALFAWLEDNLGTIKAKDPAILAETIARCCAIKSDIIAKDVRDTGDIRAWLNLGHTFGHAYEAIAGYDGTVLHGEAVAVGMVDAWRLTTQRGATAQSDLDRIMGHFTAADLPVARHDLGGKVADAAPEDIVAIMRGDKKARGGHISLVLPGSIGTVAVENNVPEAEIIAILTT